MCIAAWVRIPKRWAITPIRHTLCHPRLFWPVLPFLYCLALALLPGQLNVNLVPVPLSIGIQFGQPLSLQTIGVGRLTFCNLFCYSSSRPMNFCTFPAWQLTTTHDLPPVCHHQRKTYGRTCYVHGTCPTCTCWKISRVHRPERETNTSELRETRHGSYM